MKRSLIYTAVFSAILVMAGCSSNDDAEDTHQDANQGQNNNQESNNQNLPPAKKIISGTAAAGAALLG